MRATIALILSIVLIPAAACDSSAPTITSGVDQSVAISDMDEAQAIALCEASKEAGKLTAEMASSMGVCMTAGIMVLAFGGDSASCQAAVDECEAESSGDVGFEAEETEEVPCDGTFGEGIGSECTATVGDYEACGNAARARGQRYSHTVMTTRKAERSTRVRLHATKSICPRNQRGATCWREANVP